MDFMCLSKYFIVMIFWIHLIYQEIKNDLVLKNKPYENIVFNNSEIIAK